MRVLVIPSWYPTEDNKINGIFFKEQTEALNRYGIEVSLLYINVMSLKKLKSNKEKLGLVVNVENGIKVYRYNTFNPFPKLEALHIKYHNYVFKKYLKKILDMEESFDLVHIHSALLAGIGYSTCKDEIKLPYIITEHSSSFDRGLIHPEQTKYLGNTFDCAAAVTVVGSSLKEKVSEYTYKDRIRIIPNYITLGTKEIKKDYTKARFRFFSLGSLLKHKGMDLLIEAFNSTFKGSEVELYIGGQGEEERNLRTLIDNYGLNNQVKLLGALSREEVSYYMYNCDCFVLPSRFETFGVVYIEALAFGKPIIGARVGGPETIINDINGLLINKDDKSGLEQAMKYIYDNHQDYNAEEIIVDCNNRFSEASVIKNIVKVYEDVIDKGRI